VNPDGAVARCWTLGGQVQGVGYRPFVYRLAHELAVGGFVQNRGGTVTVVAEGRADVLDAFGQALIASAPALADPRVLACIALPPTGNHSFRIIASQAERSDVHVPADTWCCPQCLAEMSDPADRRFRYPFINCTQCGPRYTLIHRLPYDRANTSMAGFQLCRACDAEYRDPANRRFHAEPLACPDCGPTLRWQTPDGNTVDDNEAALARALTELRQGRILALKGVGGYHLCCNALDGAAVRRLRERKRRPDKPLAVLYSQSSLESDAHPDLMLDNMIREALRAPTRPIVLTPLRAGGRLPDAIAPGLSEVGVLCPSSPLQHLLVTDFGGPLVMTSGNLSGDPILTDPIEARDRLASVADSFLHHDRPIVRPADDPVMRPIASLVRPLRLGRGQAPVELELPFTLAHPILAVGGHMKNTVAMGWENRAVISPHLGDQESPGSRRVFRQLIADLKDLYGQQPSLVIHDAHPDYASSRWARLSSGLPVHAVHHHFAHASALAVQTPSCSRWLIFTWDGAGLGPDGTLWGGEALMGRPGHWQRVASLMPFRLPGGERAAREPWRSAAGLSWEAGVPWQAPALLREAWEKGINSPWTSAAGRLFDGAAAILGLCTHATYEGQAPMQLEAVATAARAIPLPLLERPGQPLLTDWRPLLEMLTDRTLTKSTRAGCFNASLAQAIAAQARAVRDQVGDIRIGLTGGVFQNRKLVEQTSTVLGEAGFDVELNRWVPANDAGLSLGQIVEGVFAHAP